MAEANITALETRTAEAINYELNDIGCHLAGVRDTLHRLVDDGAGDAGTILYMLAEICDRANTRICACASEVSDLGNEGGAA